MGWKFLAPGAYEGDPSYEADDFEKLEALIKLSHIPIQTRSTHRFSAWQDREGEANGFNISVSFVNGEVRPPLLLLYGKPGLGKTHLALSIGWAFLAQLRSVCYYHVGDLLDALRQGYRVTSLLVPGGFHKDSFDAIMNYVKKCSLLILDDLGVQKETDWVAERLDTIIDHRYVNSLPTVVTANTLELPERIFDRMREGRVVRLHGESYRAIRQRLRRGNET